MRVRTLLNPASAILIALASIWLASPAVAASVEAGDILVLLSDRGTGPLTRGIYRVDPEVGSWELVLPIAVLPPPPRFCVDGGRASRGLASPQIQNR